MKSLVALASCCILSGCVLSHHSHLTTHGSEISPNQIAEIRPGETDRQWILDNLGKPDRIHASRDGVTIYEYVGKTIRKSDTDFILLFSWDSERVVEKVVTRIVMRNEVVESVEMVEA
jgi:outer membrane protein assembly factor BamE (lipoprotein component of BamABCDE complex)